jgi:hypothetical protein
MERPEGYTVSIREDRKLYGQRDTKGQWPDGTTKYNVTIKNSRGKTMSFPYHTGPAVTDKPTAKDVIQAVISDGSFYEQYPSLEEFMLESGFDPEDQMKEGKRAYDACKSMSERTRAIFGDDFDDMQEWSQDN